MSATAKAAGVDGPLDLKLEGATKPITSGQPASRASRGAASRASAQANGEAREGSAQHAMESGAGGAGPGGDRKGTKAEGTGISSRSRSHTVSDLKHAAGA